MGAVALDANVIIGFLDPGDTLHHQALELLRPWVGASHTILIAASVYAEILVQPMRLGLADTIETFLADMRVEVVPIDRSVAHLAADLRAHHTALRLPDALALAVALEREAQFLTLDIELQHVAERLG
jgi:predicted nucleic acid-binding protein